jgi:hypothetical protein
MKQCCGSGIFIPDLRSRTRIFSIPDPGPIRFLDPGSGTASTSKSLGYPKIVSELSKVRYDPKCSSRIRISVPNIDYLPIPDPEEKKH